MNKNEKAQVSVEYLLTLMFAVLLILVVTILAFNLSKIADQAQLEVIENRDKTIASLLG
ncbi:MAG: hypothetical protein QXZ13_02695 [Candidatus Diapherotrites archaeon]